MKGKKNSSSPSKPKNGEQQIENHLEKKSSGAYIRSFVKQMTSSTTTNSNHEEQKNSSEQFDPNNEKNHKKQVRRRLQSRKPYQERLLNMAEARREIVTALKLHRAAKKETQQPGPGPEIAQSRPDIRIGPEQEPKLKSRRNPRIYASNCVHSPGPYYPSYYYYSWPVSSIAPPPQENYNFALPSQTLGLNLNLQDFNNPSMLYSYSPPSISSPSAPPSVAGAPAEEIGDDDKLIDSEVIGPEDLESEEFVNSAAPFDEVMQEFPAWIEDENESYCLEQVIDDVYSFQDYALPCMDIEEIEGMDGDWLA